MPTIRKGSDKGTEGLLEETHIPRNTDAHTPTWFQGPMEKVN